MLTLQQSISPGRSSLYRCFSPNDSPCSWRKKLAAAVKYAWIHQQRPEFTVSRMCRLLAVSRSGYYEWLSRPPCAQTEAEQALQDMITRYFAQGTFVPNNPPTDTFNTEIRDRCRTMAYLMSINPGATVTK